MPSRAARVYLDVAFFHPFDDGNSRSALLTLCFILARDGVILDYASPVHRISRSVLDAAGTAGLAVLIDRLINRTRTRGMLPPDRTQSPGGI